ncbi:NACHT domain-containing protein [Streptomyces sp. NBC_00370]|uniref:NACHT domain-containing protein n=1 Tax=Streptomyces sp. NBC_00370 TaxID=2975728 RepID=UPI002E25EE5C
MDPTVPTARLASSVVVPLVKKLFQQDGPGAGLVDRPVRISSLVSFRGEKRTLSEQDLHKLTATLVRRAVEPAGPGERPVPIGEDASVALALARTLYSLGDLDMEDVQAVRFGPQALARAMRSVEPNATRHLSAAAANLHDALLETACVYILHFFTQRSTFVPRTLVQHSQALADSLARTDELLRRVPSQFTQDALFEARYAAHIAHKHNMLTIYGIDLTNSPEQWPLDAAYLSLEAGFAHESRRAPIRGEHATIRAEHAFHGRDRVLLRGEAGSGKTTLVQWMAVTAARQDRAILREGGSPLAPFADRVPFVLPIRSLTRQDDDLPTPDHFLSRIRSPLAAAQPPGWTDRVLAAGRGLILIDGIDETPEKVRERTRRWLQDLITVYPGNLWLVTSRPSAVRPRWLAAETFAELSLAPMSRSGVDSFIHRWHNAARSVSESDEQREQLDMYETSLGAAVRSKNDLARLATNPLMCGLICALHCDRRGYLPHARKELYEAALSMLLSRRDRERDMASPDGVELTEEPKIRLLQRLAYKFILNGKAELDYSHAERIIADTLPGVPVAAAQGDASTIFRHLLLRSGLLREPADGSIDFIHRTFQDYLGAKAAVEEGDISLLVLRAAETQWEDVIRMAAAHARPAECAEFLLDIARRGDSSNSGYRRTQLHLVAAAAMEHATELQPRVRAEIKERTAALIPPKTSAEAKDLAGIGSVALELLPGPHGLTDEQCLLTVETAVLIGGEAALPLLSQYRDHPAVPVQQLLSTAWHRFDTRAYAESVLAGLTEDEVYYEVTSQDELTTLRELATPSRLRVADGLTSADLVRHVRPGRLTHLWVPGSMSATWFWLSGFPLLHTLTLAPGRPEPAPGLPVPGVPVPTLDLSSLAAHPALRTVRVVVDQPLAGTEHLAGTVEVVEVRQTELTW